MRSATILAVLAAAFCVLFTSPASAAGVYTVSNIKVDVTGADPGSAREAGFARARQLGFDRLVKRLTIPDDVARLGAPQLTPAEIEQLVSSVQIEQERPSGSRYVGQLSLNFDPSGVRKTLRDRGLAVVDTRTAAILVVPQYQGAADLASQWYDAWAKGGFGDELVPVSVAPNTLTGSPNWTAAAPFASAAGATSALYANARLAGASIVVDLVEVGANGARRERGPVTVPLASGDQAGAFQRAAEASLALVQNEWKARLAVGGGGQKTRITVSAFYGNQAEWGRLKKGLEASAKTLISAVSIDAVAKEGSVISFAYVGSKDQLAAELLRNGVVFKDTPQGPTLRLAPSPT